ncbi:MAG: ribosome assembly RNA-binding protein YhbY [Syntrophotalea sp.]|uniref:ribosome assembly RNA-binding protein YhbY n=1 Tax=Syntrophotalea sp. TaxID=2812029 RepID=UPI003D0FCD27
MAGPKLTGKQARYLRSLGHHLNVAAMVGKDGVNDNLVESVEESLVAHELVKIKLQRGCPLDRHEIADQLAHKTGAAVAQILGQTILLYRPGDKREITLR